MNFMKWMHTIARLTFAVVVVYAGFLIYEGGNEFYGPFLHAYRRLLAPEMKNRINQDWTFEELHNIAIQVLGGLMMLSGALIALNRTFLGPLILMICVLFMIGTQDNPWIKDYIKPAPKLKVYRWNDLCRHISIVGVCLLLMTTSY